VAAGLTGPAWHDRTVVAVLVALLVALVIFGTAAALIRREGDLATDPPDRGDVGLPADRDLRADDLDHIAFGLVIRGYRMSEVDDVLDRLRDLLAAKDAEIDRLRAAQDQRAAATTDDTAGPAR
jgi:DivIVA domain-containing protein